MVALRSATLVTNLAYRYALLKITDIRVCESVTFEKKIDDNSQVHMLQGMVLIYARIVHKATINHIPTRHHVYHVKKVTIAGNLCNISIHT